jgi:hypothetical protein
MNKMNIIFVNDLVKIQNLNPNNRTKVGDIVVRNINNHFIGFLPKNSPGSRSVKKLSELQM